MTKIGQKIEQRREQLGLTPKTFAKKIGITPQRLWELENTSTRPSAEVLLKVAEALDTTMLYFLTDCELNDVDEQVLLTKFRKLSKDRKKLSIEIVKLMEGK
jgi:transcriptional regulator with XRE-family HTH domain